MPIIQSLTIVYNRIQLNEPSTEKIFFVIVHGEHKRRKDIEDQQSLFHKSVDHKCETDVF